MENCLDFENGYCFRNDSDCQGICEDYIDKHKIAEAAKLFFADPQDKEYHDINWGLYSIRQSFFASGGPSGGPTFKKVAQNFNNPFSS